MTTLAEEIEAAQNALRQAAEGRVLDFGEILDPNFLAPGPEEPITAAQPTPTTLLPVTGLSAPTPAQGPQPGDVAAGPTPYNLQSTQTGGGIYTSTAGRQYEAGAGASLPSGRARGPEPAVVTLRPEPLGLGQMEMANAQQLEGRTGAGMLQGEQSLQEAALFDEQAEGDRAVMEHFARVSREHEQGSQDEIRRLASLLDEMAANRIDPNRMFSGPGGGSARLGAAVAIAGGFISSVYTQQPNAALDIINRAVERDLQAQIANQGQQRAVMQGRLSLIDAMRNAYRDETSALLAARAIRLQEAANRLKALQARTASASTAANLQQVLGQLRVQQLTHLDELQSRQWEVRMSADPRNVPSFVDGMRQQQVNARRMQVAEAAANTITQQQLQQELGPQMDPAQAPVQEPLGAPQMPVQGGPARGVAAPSRTGARRAPGASQGAGLPPLPPGYSYNFQEMVPNAVGEARPMVVNEHGYNSLPMFNRVFGASLEPRSAENIRLEGQDLGSRPEETLPPGARYMPRAAHLWDNAVDRGHADPLLDALDNWHTYTDAVGTLSRELNTEMVQFTPEALRQNSLVDQLTGLALILKKLGAPDAMQEVERETLLVHIMGGPPGRFASDTQVELLNRWFRNAERFVRNRARRYGLEWTNPGNTADPSLNAGAEETTSTRGGRPDDSGVGSRVSEELLRGSD